jgi:membrane protease YdiL (CAAX protease family)
MSKIRPLPAFFVLAFALSWYPWLIAIAHGKTSGPNPLGPLVAAILVTAVAERKAGLKSFFSRLVRWKVAISGYAVVLLLPAAVCALAAAGSVLLGARMAPLSKLPSWQELPGRFLFIFLFIGLGEEPGWRGFALPHLQRRHSPLVASLVLAPIWALWHLPLLGTEFPLPVVPAFLLSIFSATIVHTWIFNRTSESVLLQMLFHAAVNTVGAGYLFRLFSGVDLVRLWWIYASLWALLAIGVTLAGRAGGRAPSSFRKAPSAPPWPPPASRAAVLEAPCPRG